MKGQAQTAAGPTITDTRGITIPTREQLLLQVIVRESFIRQTRIHTSEEGNHFSIIDS